MADLHIVQGQLEEVIWLWAGVKKPSLHIPNVGVGSATGASSLMMTPQKLNSLTHT